ncbi:MAG: maleylpyruvate isomerase family mycothiol-dependent enzyme [Chloroflexi bacterium]|nr:maleylpyruvate isomerase family mycothiol-dependent enzyme [Chloroflexota bacterium]
MSDEEIVDKMEAVWRSIENLCSSLSDQDWATTTDCPGWSVQDQLSHLVGSETRLLGRPAPDHTPKELSHTKNEAGARNEVLVDWRRSWPGPRVLEEFREVTGLRLEVLRAMGPGDFEAETQTPIGPGTVRDLLAIRIFDAWVHEQDMRRAVNRPGHLEGPVAEHAMGRMAMAMPYVIGRKVQPADGTEVVFDVTGAAGRVLAVAMEGTRAKYLESPPDSPAVRLGMDVETFACLTCGRWSPDEAMGSGKVAIDGDRALGERILGQMNIMI